MASNAELKAELDAIKEITAEQADKIEELKLENEELREQIAAGSVAKKPLVNPIPNTQFKVGKNSYVFTAGAFYLMGQRITAQEALKDDELLKLLVEEEYGVIKPA